MHKDELNAFIGRWLPRLEDEMRAEVQNGEAAVGAIYGMLQYHLGWVDQHFLPAPIPTGKRLRPIFCLLACTAVGGDPVQALPAAVAIELLHNFSLIHDDIEDGDEVRRHRPTVWKVWGIPQAINSGDALFALAFAALQRLPQRGVSPQVTLAALEIFTQTCVALTEGQHLDIGFEDRTDVTVNEYLRMIQGKTAALVGASLAIGALTGKAMPTQAAQLRQFGEAVGLAFQIQDDILGIWGDPAVTGKAAGNDLLRRKKSLPTLYALNHARVGEQFETLLQGEVTPAQLPLALKLLEQAGARPFAEDAMRSRHATGLAALEAALGGRYATSALLGLAEGLLHRRA